MTIQTPARITREMLRAWDACYDDDEIAELVPPEGVTPLAVCDAAHVPPPDRLWALLHEEIIPAPVLRRLAVRWARGALEAERAAGREPDERSWAAADVAERYARGDATDAELAAAWTAARDAARDAAWTAAWTAASAATCAAWDAADAAWDAADAAWAAARDATWVAADAGWDAVRAAQLADVRRVLLGGEP